MPTRPSFPSLFLLLAVLFFHPGGAWGKEWYEHYLRAEKALAKENWAEAVEEVQQALSKKSDSGERVRTYGMNFIDYFPYWKMAVAFQGLKQWDAALQALDTEERLGAIGRVPTALAELRQLRTGVEESRQAQAARQASRIEQIVEQSLLQARVHEEAGRIVEAIETLTAALATAPDDSAVQQMLERLQQRMGEREEQQARERQWTRWVEQGRTFLTGGDYDEAARSFRQALDLKPTDAEVGGLLDQARQGLRKELDAAGAQRTQVVTRALVEARRMEKAGDLGAALDSLQRALALDPGNREALALQDRLLATRAAQAATDSRRLAVDRLLSEASAEIEAGRGAGALSAALRVLALDATNNEAKSLVSQAHQLISRALLVSVTRENLPPAVVFPADARVEGADGMRREVVREKKFRLDGLVIDESQVRDLAFFADGHPISGLASGGRTVGNLFLTEFSLDHQLEAGATLLRLVATDTECARSSVEYSVFYERPLHRAPSFYLALAAAASILLSTLLWRQIRFRRRLLQRRFNPYVAGAPILDETLFFGRQDLLDQILQTVHNNSLLLYGERRIGKTSLQHQLRRRLLALEDPAYQFFPVYVDLQGTPQERFFGTLTEDIFHELEQKLGGLRPLTSPESDSYSYRDLVRDLRRAIDTLKARTTKQVKLVLLIDEVDELNYYDPKINQKLRSLFMKSFAENLVAVVSGVAIKKQWEMEGSPWYNFFEEIQVTPFRREHARELIERPIRGVFKIESGVVERIIQLTDAKPYLIQKLLMALVSRLHEAKRRKITLADVEAVGGSSQG